MKRHHFLIFFLIIGANIIMGTQCGKDHVTPDPTYKFLEKLTLSPYKKIYSINDTIWVQFQTADKSLYDQLSNTRISTDTTFLRGGFYYYRRYPVKNVQEFFCDVDIDNSLNPEFTTLYTWYNVLNFATDCNSSRFFFKIGFIPKMIGVYSIEPNLTAVDCANKVNRNYTTTNFIFDLADCNKDVWLSIPPGSRGGEDGFTDVRIDKKEIFVFRVE
jgi:hypothetical protein